MRARFQLLTAVLLFGSATVRPAGAQSALEGSWTSVSASLSGRMSTVLIFDRGGILRTMLAQRVAGFYRVDRDTLVVLDSAGGRFASFRIAGDGLVRRVGRADVALTRSGGTEVPGAPFAGLWSYPYPDPAMRTQRARLQLTSGGCARHFWSSRDQSGRWEQLGDSLTMALPGRPATRTRVELRGDTLVIGDDSQSGRFRRLSVSDTFAPRDARCDIPTTR